MNDQSARLFPAQNANTDVERRNEKDITNKGIVTYSIPVCPFYYLCDSGSI